MIIFPGIGDVIEVQRFNGSYMGTVTAVVRGRAYPIQVRYGWPVSKSVDDKMGVCYEWVPVWRVPSVKIVFR